MYRGLSTFISDVRNCKYRVSSIGHRTAEFYSWPHFQIALLTLAGKTKEQEQQRVDKELANCRKAFTSGKMQVGYACYIELEPHLTPTRGLG